MSAVAGVRRLGPASRDLWDAVARRCSYATYFHTRAWSELTAAVRPVLSIATEAFRLADEAEAVLPLLARAQGVFRHYESMVPGVYGGPIAERDLRADEVEAILGLMVTPQTSHLRIFGNPYLEAFAAESAEADEFTHVIDLRDGFDAVFGRFHRNHRRTYRQGRASGLVVARATTLQDFRDYFAVYRRDRARWGERATTDDPWSLFEEIHRRADPNVVLWLAKLDGRVVAGDLWLYWNAHNVGWHGAADPAFFKVHPTNFLLTEIIREACDRGARWLDLNPSGGHAGVVAFKDSFGAERRYFRHRDRRGSALYRGSRRLVKSLRRRAKRLLRSLRSERTCGSPSAPDSVSD